MAKLGFLANKPIQSFSNLIPYFSEDSKLLIRRGAGWVFKTLMESPAATGK